MAHCGLRPGSWTGAAGVGTALSQLPSQVPTAHTHQGPLPHHDQRAGGRSGRWDHGPRLPEGLCSGQRNGGESSASLPAWPPRPQRVEPGGMGTRLPFTSWGLQPVPPCGPASVSHLVPGVTSSSHSWLLSTHHGQHCPGHRRSKGSQSVVPGELCPRAVWCWSCESNANICASAQGFCSSGLLRQLQVAGCPSPREGC